MSRKQKTINKPVTLSGVSLHNGIESSVTLRPADEGTGIVFHLTSDAGVIDIPLVTDAVTAGDHRTQVSGGGHAVETVEHLLAAAYGMDVDNLHVDCTATELPAGDGSAARFVALLDEAGVVEQEAEANVFVLKRPFTVSDGKGGLISAVPSKTFRVGYTIDYAESALARGFFETEITPELFRDAIAPARTFCMESVAEKMRAAGLGQGADYQNTLVLRESDAIDTELRFADEPARHKVLDFLGDMAVIGRPVQMQVMSLRGGHTLNAQFVKALREEMIHQDFPRGVLDTKAIENTLPHRYPFLLVDRILSFEPGKRIVGMKNLTRNEEFFNGHFPGQPVMPGVLQIEAMAQTGAVLMRKSTVDSAELLAVLMSVTDVKYRRPVVPGDQLVMTIEMEKFRGKIGQVMARATVDGDVASEARIKFALVDNATYTG